MLNFKDCTLATLERDFHVKEIEPMAELDTWLTDSAAVEISAFETQTLLNLRKHLRSNAHDWNEAELSQYFIGPLFSLVDYTTEWCNLFAERSLSGVVDGIECGGKPDGMIASGVRQPERPYFCFHEYKKERDPEGDPAGQALAAMLVAQALNEQAIPIYGCYVKGRDWSFMTLRGKQYAISEPYIATRDDIFEIVRILKALKQLILALAH